MEQRRPGGGSPRKARKGKKVPPPVTPDSLQSAALRYLGRYASSTHNLREVLRRRVMRAARHHDIDPAAAEKMISTIVAKLDRAGLLDDAAYAETRARSLHRAGASRRRIAAQLRRKGVAKSDIAAAMAALQQDVAPNDEDADIDYLAAIRYARRRRFGPYRDAAKRSARRDKDLAAMARAGFSLDLARAVVDAEDVDALDALIVGENP